LAHVVRFHLNLQPQPPEPVRLSVAALPLLLRVIGPTPSSAVGGFPVGLDAPRWERPGLHRGVPWIRSAAADSRYGTVIVPSMVPLMAEVPGAGLSATNSACPVRVPEAPSKRPLPPTTTYSATVLPGPARLAQV